VHLTPELINNCFRGYLCQCLAPPKGDNAFLAVAVIFTVDQRLTQQGKLQVINESAVK
jgi:hypothetical protein